MILALAAALMWWTSISNAAAESSNGAEAAYIFENYLFNDLEIVDQSADTRFFPSNNTVQLEANGPGHHVSFQFPVDTEGVYELHLKPWRAPSYARYNVYIDGKPAKEIDFYGTSKEIEFITEMKLEKGQHTIKFDYSGITAGSTNYKMGVTELYLVRNYSAGFTDLAELERSSGLETDAAGDALRVNSVRAGQFIEFSLPVAVPRTYQIRLTGKTDPSGGIARLWLDGNSIGTMDFYGKEDGETELNAASALGNGLHRLRVEVTGRNEASDGYRMILQNIVLSLNGLEMEKIRQEADLKINSLEDQLASINGRLLPSDAAQDQALRLESEELGERFSSLQSRNFQPELSLGEASALLNEAEQLSLLVKRFGSFVEARYARPKSAFGLLSADSMQLVYSKEIPCPCSTNPTELSLAQGEYESIQAVLLPYGETLRNVSAQVTRVIGPNGEVVPDSILSVSVAPLGSVYVSGPGNFVLPALADRPSGYKGWIPDPIRTDITGVDVSAWDMQPFWIELHADSQTKPGTYRIEVSFLADGANKEVMEIRVLVWPFAIPDRPDLATSMTMNPEIIRIVYGITDPAQFDHMHRKYIDFLETFKIEPDQIYTRTPPSVEDLLKIQNKWGLRQFNAYYFYPGWMNLDVNNPNTWQAEIDRMLNEIEVAMEKYEQAGLADKAYVYGFDEGRANHLPLAKELFTQLKQRFPDLPIMTTYMDPTLGAESGLAGLVDIWVPGVEKFNNAARIQAQSRGDRVYWYTHQAVRDPLPNWFNGYAPSDTRILLGPMSHKMDVDGFLYYNITRWVSPGNNFPMNDDILSNWNPLTYPTVNGDGSLFYPGVDGPLASQRIHNFRDGMEDYNLLNVLEASIKRAENAGAPGNLLAEAGVLLNADAVVTNEREYTKDAAAYRQWRKDVARMIVQLMSADLLESDLKTYISSGDVKQPLASQLTNQLKQAVHHLEFGRHSQALHSLENLLQHLNNEENADAISDEVKVQLRQDVRKLMAKWQEATVS